MFLEKVPNTLWSLRIILALLSDMIDSDIVPFFLIVVSCVISFDFNIVNWFQKLSYTKDNIPICKSHCLQPV